MKNLRGTLIGKQTEIKPRQSIIGDANIFSMQIPKDPKVRSSILPNPNSKGLRETMLGGKGAGNLRNTMGAQPRNLRGTLTAGRPTEFGGYGGNTTLKPGEAKRHYINASEHEKNIDEVIGFLEKSVPAGEEGLGKKNFKKSVLKTPSLQVFHEILVFLLENFYNTSEVKYQYHFDDFEEISEYLVHLGYPYVVNKNCWNLDSSNNWQHLVQMLKWLVSVIKEERFIYEQNVIENFPLCQVGADGLEAQAKNFCLKVLEKAPAENFMRVGFLESIDTRFMEDGLERDVQNKKLEILDTKGQIQCLNNEILEFKKIEGTLFEMRCSTNNAEHELKFQETQIPA
jgi:hypothetical protein